MLHSPTGACRLRDLRALRAGCVTLWRMATEQLARPPRGATRAGAARSRPGFAELADHGLDGLLAAFAAWTVVYHVCVVLRLDAGEAGIAGLLAAVPAAWLALRPGRHPAGDTARTGVLRGGITPGRGGGTRRRAPLALATAVVGALTAVLFAFTDAPWGVIWASWLLAAGLAVAAAGGDGRHEADDGAPSPRPGRLEGLAVAAWAVGLAVFSLLLLAPDGDDAYYVHWATWIAAHGEFPVRDVVYSDQVFPSLYFPPAPSYEPLVGVVSRAASVPTPDLMYLVVPPVGSALAVLALWRLLRTWRVPMAALALSVALLFLLFDAQDHRMPGAFFVGRMWQGKVLFLCLLVPTLLVALHAYATRPSRRGLALLAAAGIAGVGLTTTAIFVVPVVALGALAPLLVRRPREALAGLVAATAYPAVAGAVTLAVGGRQPEEYTLADVVPRHLVQFVFGIEGLAVLGLFAVLVGPVVLRRPLAGRMTAATALLVGLLYAPPVPRLIFEVTDLGRVLWRLNWALPTAALLGALATSVVARRFPLLLRVVPAVAVCAAVVAVGQPLWSAQAHGEIASRPTWKRDPGQVAAARLLLARARPGDVILAPRYLSQTILVMSGEVTTVNPRGFFTRALREVPGARARERVLLQRFVDTGLGARRGPARRREIRRALRVVGVDLACVRAVHPPTAAVVARAGYRPVSSPPRMTCFARRGAGTRPGGR